jgi:hypothetical protein
MPGTEYFGVPPGDKTEVENRFTYTATANQVLFPAIYSVGYVDVYINGVWQDPRTKFTALNGQSITLTTACTGGETVGIVSRRQLFTVGNEAQLELPLASETTLGIAQYATVAETQAGTLRTKAVTPYGLAQAVTSMINDPVPTYYGVTESGGTENAWKTTLDRNLLSDTPVFRIVIYNSLHPANTVDNPTLEVSNVQWLGGNISPAVLTISKGGAGVGETLPAGGLPGRGYHEFIGAAPPTGILASGTRIQYLAPKDVVWLGGNQTMTGQKTAQSTSLTSVGAGFNWNGNTHGQIVFVDVTNQSANAALGFGAASNIVPLTSYCLIIKHGPGPYTTSYSINSSSYLFGAGGQPPLAVPQSGKLAFSVFSFVGVSTTQLLCIGFNMIPL